MWRRKRLKKYLFFVVCSILFFILYDQLITYSISHNSSVFLNSLKYDKQNGVIDPQLRPLNFRQSGLSNNTTGSEFNQTQLSSSVAFQLIHKRGYDCQQIVLGNKKEIEKAKRIAKPTLSFIADAKYVNLTRNCTDFKTSNGYMDYFVTQDEVEFPIAYSIILYKEVEQMERLLRAIYRPQNIYCVHIDLSANPEVHKGVKSIVNCFKNVFLVSKAEDIVYAGMSRLKADLNCMEDLLKKNVRWKYFINLPSQEYPLKTNREIVQILKIYNGANDIEGITEPHRMRKERLLFRHVYAKNRIYRTQVKKKPPSHNITVVKGSAYGVFSRAFVNFILTDKRSQDLLHWMEDVLSPDEFYWATLQHDRSLNAPGGYKGIPDKKPWLASYSVWGPKPCKGKYVRGVCVFGVGDLPEIVKRKELFVNKVYLNYQPATLECLEEWLNNKTFSNMPFDLSYYRKLPFVNSSN